MSTHADQPIYASISRRDRALPARARPLAVALGAVALGLAVGVLTAWGQARLHGPVAAFTNSESAWLLAPFVIGTLTRRPRVAACAGLVCCLAQLVGYDAWSQLERGYGVGGGYDVFWGVAAVLGGPVFGLAGRVTRCGSAGMRGLGPAALSAAFLAEGLWAYLHVLHEPATAALWIAIGTAIALAGLRGVRGWRWLAVTLPLALVVEMLVSRVAAGWAW